MVYRTAKAISPNAVDTAPDRARYFRAVMSGTWGAGPWEGEIAQCSFNFVFGSLPDEIQARAECPSTLIESAPSTDRGSILVGAITSCWRVWQTENVGNNPLNNVWIHRDESDAIANACVAFLTSARKYQDAAFHWDTLKLYAMNSLHESINGPNLYYFSLAGTGTTEKHPPQASVVVTHGTIATGKGASGRMYIPAHHLALTNTLTLPSAAMTDVVTYTKALRDAVVAVDTEQIAGQNPFGTKCRPAVVHRAQMQFSDWTVLGVGDRMDTQRRRANKGSENYGWTSL